MQQASRAWAIANNSIVDGGWGPEFLAFAMWAFSEDRLLDLRILAYGVGFTGCATWFLVTKVYS
jgi:hypothetical protein